MNGTRVYQIDGNLGGTAAIAEMLLQSHEDEIAVLPALPSAWPDGRFRGLRARGAVEVDAEWSGGRASMIRLRSAVPQEVRVRIPHGQHVLAVSQGHTPARFETKDEDTILIRLEPRNEYSISLK